MRKALSLTVVVLGGCLSETEVPPGAQITCVEGRDECPSGFSCRNQTCVPTDRESTPPEITNVTVERPEVGAVSRFAPGQTVRVGFDTSEALESVEVRLEAPLAAPITSRRSGGSGTLSVDLAVPDGATGSADLVIEGIDTAGNLGVARLPARVFFDSAAPGLTTPALVSYFPAPSNLQSVGVTSATAGTTVQVSLSFREPLLQTPEVQAEPLSFAVVADENPFFTFEATVGETVSSGTYLLTASATDEAGNTDPAVDLEASVAVDIDSPPPVTGLVYVREPWGTAGRTTPEFRVEGESAAGEANSTVVFFDRAEAEGRVPLARVEVDSEGMVPTAILNASDGVRVYAVAVDGAGNEATPVLISNARWRATFRAKTSGNVLSNPHSASLVGAADEALVSSIATEPSDAEYAAIGDCESCDSGSVNAMTLISSNRWSRRDTDSPPDTVGAGVAHMTSNGKTFLFSGIQSDSFSSAMWEWDGLRWREVDLLEAPTPPASFAPSMTYDSLRDRIVFAGGGASLDRFNNDVWEWDGLVWRGIPAPDAPNGISLPIAYDSTRGVSIVIGDWVLPDLADECPDGYARSQLEEFQVCVSSRVSEWNGSSWADRTPACDDTEPECQPTPLFGASAAYDPVLDQFVLFGGIDFTVADAVSDETWVWDGVTWTPAPTSGGPAARAHANLVYSPSAEGILLFGGCTDAQGLFECTDFTGGGNPPLTDVWRWGRSGWEPLPDPLPAENPAVPARHYGQAVADSGRGEIIWFGGSYSTGVTADCDEPAFRCADGQIPEDRGFGTGGDRICVCFPERTAVASVRGPGQLNWSIRSGPGETPDAQRDPALAVSPVSGETWSFGGEDRIDMDCDGTGSETCGSFWRYDGASWTEFPGPTRPDDVHEAEDAWCNSPAMAPVPCPAAAPLLGFVGSGGSERLVVVGDNLRCTKNQTDCHATWSTPVAGESLAWEAMDSPPAPRENGAAVTVRRGDVLDLYVYGGRARTSCGDLTSFGINRSNSTSFEMDGSCLLGDFLRFRGDGSGSWEPVSTTGPSPGPRLSHAMAFDPTRNRIVLVGGCNAVDENGDRCEEEEGLMDVWEWDIRNSNSNSNGNIGSWEQITAEVPFRAGGLIDSHATFDTERRRLVLFGGGPFNSAGGNQLYEYNGTSGTWIEVAQSGAVPTPRRRQAVEYLASRDALLVVGGGVDGEVWTRDMTPESRGSITLEYAWDAAEVGAIGSIEAQEALVGATLTVVAQAVGFTVATASPFEGARAPGFTVQGWNGVQSRWQDLPAGSTATDGFSRLDIELDRNAVREFLFRGQNRFYFRVGANEGTGNGAGPATVDLDFTTLEVRYTTP